MAANPVLTRGLTIDRIDAWAIHDCLQSQLAGFSGRHETAEPWHATSLLIKIRSSLLTLEGPGPPKTLDLELCRGELECIDLNVPRTAYQGATALLLRVFHALEELRYELPLLGEEPDRSGLEGRLAQWRRNGPGDTPIPT